MWSLALAFAAPVDPVALASRLLADGHLDRAAAVLAELDDPTDPRALALIGLVAVRQGRWDDARAALTRATEDPDVDPMVWVSLAQAEAGREDWAGVLGALENADGVELPAVPQLRGRAQAALGQLDAAYGTLLDGSARFPDHPGLAEDRLGLLVDLGLTREVLDGGADLLATTDADARGWVAIGDRLRRAGATDGALDWLEEVRLRFPDDVDARLALGRACLDAGRPLCAGDALAEAAAFDPEHADEAAECYRRAGALDRAMFWNAAVVDPATKVRQRLGLLIELGHFDQAVALDPRARRLDLLQDEAVAYALAFAHASVGDTPAAEALLTGISDPRLFEQATALRESLR